MTSDQRRLFDAIWQESENILEGQEMTTIPPARCPECEQLLPVVECTETVQGGRP